MPKGMSGGARSGRPSGSSGSSGRPSGSSGSSGSATSGNRNRQRPPPPPDAGNTKPAFGGSLGAIGIGAGLGIAGSQLFGGSDTAIGSALNNVSEGVGDAVGDVGGAVGSLASGAGTAVGAVGQGVGSGIGSVGAGLGSMTQYIPLALAGGAIFLVYSMSQKGGQSR